MSSPNSGSKGTEHMRRRLFLTVVAGALIAAFAATSALAQQGEVRGSTVATGVLGEPYTQGQDPEPLYRLTDEATGTNYVLMSGFVDLDPYVGQRVTVWGAPVGGADDALPALNVTHIEVVEGPGNGGTVTANFELTVECQPPVRTGFAASVGEAPVATGALLDQDGDGVYTVSLPIERGAEHGAVIERLDPISAEPLAPVTASTIKDFGSVEFNEDKVFRANVSFCGGEDNNGEEPEQQPQCFLPEGCFLSGDGSDEAIVGGIGPDYIIGGGGHDAVHGLGGGDWLDGGAGDDLVRGNDGDDLVDGGSGHDLVRGNDGNDYVTGFTGNDILDAGGGSDFIYAADGEFDKVSGGPGYDVCVVDEEDRVTGCEEVYAQ